MAEQLTELEQLRLDNAQLLEQVNRAGSSNQSQGVLDNIKKSYTFFKSANANSTFVLPNGKTIVFEAKARILGKNADGTVGSEETWGQYFTKSPEVAQILREACSTNPRLTEMTSGEVDDVLEDLRASITVN